MAEGRPLQLWNKTLQGGGKWVGLPAFNKWIPEAWPKLARQSYLLTGAAGLAAAFNTPLGGLVFAVEELARVHVRFFRTALFTSVIIAGLATQGFLGPYLYLGYPDVGGLSFRIFPALLVVAFAAGCSGAFMCKLILRISAWKNGLPLWVQAAYVAGAGIIDRFTLLFCGCRRTWLRQGVDEPTFIYRQ
jgi:H+/Cl- antiporter ClcA